MLAEALGGLLAAVDAEAQHAAAETVAVLLEGDLALLVGVGAGVVDEENVGVALKGLADGGCVLGGLAGAEVQGLDTTVGEPAVEGRRNGANGVLEEGETLKESLRVEGGDTHADVTVAVDVLGDTVDDDVGAVLKRVLDVGRKVLSTTTMMPERWAMSVTARMSTSERVGLEGVSIQMSLVSGLIRDSMSTSMLGVKVTLTPWAEATFVK